MLVDECGKVLAILGGPRLLVTALVTAVIGNGFGGVAALSDVLGEVTLADGPFTERRDVRVVRAYCARSPALSSEMTRVLAEVARIQLVERRRTVFVLYEEVNAPIELSTRVLTVVPALTTPSFPLVRQEVLDDRFDTDHATRLRTVRRIDRRSRAE